MVACFRDAACPGVPFGDVLQFGGALSKPLADGLGGG
jgi:hypothetical protein